MAASSSSVKRILKRASPSTIQDKFLVGYQGWFTCAGDGEPIGPGHHGWLHWFNHPIPDGGRPNIDVWPDVSSYSPSELFLAPGLKFRSGGQTFLFSSRHPQTVQRHFHWMAEHGIDGAFLQRFAGQCDLDNGNEGIRKLRDEVGQRVREAAEKENRVFAIMYDVSGVPADRIQRILERDWIHLIRSQGVLDSPRYLREKGKAVVALWGFGFHNAGHTPNLIRSIVKFFRDTTPGGAYIFGGAPSCWRLSKGDADRQPEFVDIWLNEFDAISPWTIGRYKTEIEADNFAETKMKGDMELIKRRSEETGRKVDYIPVIFPGGSGYNLSEGKWGFNDIKRQGGRFLWKQVVNVKRLGVRTVYGAMWDEYDEGTAFMPIVQHKHNLPQSNKFQFMALDQDGYDVPTDWYMRICGMAAEGLRSERWIHESFPLKELTDYWSTRPKCEEINFYSETSVTGSGSGSGATGDCGQSYQEWLAAQNDDKDEPPPPPYTLTSEEEVAPTTPHTEQQSTTTASLASTLPQHSSAPIHVAPLPPQTVAANNFHAQQQRPQQAVEPVAALANDFALASVSGSSLSQNLPVASQVMGGKVAPVAPSPLHPASNNPTPNAYGRPTSQQSYSSGTDSIVSPTKASGPWSTAQWPPKEWGIDSGSAPATGGANLGRLHTFSASSSNPPGANLRPSATVSGRPATPVPKPPRRPNTASGGPPAPLTQTGTGGYHSEITMPEHPPAGFPDRPPPSPLSPHGGFGSSNYPSQHSPSSHSPGRPSFPEVPTSPFGPPYSGPSTYAWPGASGGSPSPPAGGPVPFPNQSSYLYNTPQQQYKPVGSSAMPPFHNPSGPFDNRIPLAPTMDMSAQYPPLGPVSSAYHVQDVPQGGTPDYFGYPGGTTYPQPTIPMPMAPGPMPLQPHPPPRHPYGPAPSGYPGQGESNTAFDYALSAVDMVAGRKTRDQLQSFANKFLK